MAIGETYSIFRDGKPVELPSGVYFCYDCCRKRKIIPYPHKGTINEPCPKCGCQTVFKME